MTDPGTSPAAAAWHPDPWGQAELRWHDGVQWTGHLHTRATPAEAATTSPEQAAAALVLGDGSPAALLADPTAWTLYPDATAPAVRTPDLVAHAAHKSDAMQRAFYVIAGLVVLVTLAKASFVLFLGVGLATFVWFAVKAGGASSLWAQLKAGAVKRHDEAMDQCAIRGLSATFPGMPPPGTMGIGRRPMAGEGEWPQAFRWSQVRASITGTLWHAAPGARVTVTSRGPQSSGETEFAFTIVAVPLPATVAARFPGFLVQPTRAGQLKLNGNTKNRRPFVEVDFGSIDAHRSWRVQRAPEQDELAMFELFSTTLVDSLGGALRDASFVGGVSFAVLEGTLWVWEQYDPFTCTAAGAPPAHSTFASLDILLSLTRDVHRRLVEEWQ